MQDSISFQYYIVTAFGIIKNSIVNVLSVLSDMFVINVLTFLVVSCSSLLWPVLSSAAPQ